MKRGYKIYSISQLVSAIVMILALVWLTVSSPFVFATQQELAKQQKMEKTAIPVTDSEEGSSNSDSSNAEEKTTGNNSLIEEYLNNNNKGYCLFSASIQYHMSVNSDIYIAFHGEQLVPPPNVL